MRRIFSGTSFSVGGHRLLVPFNLGCSCTNLSRRFNFSASLLLLTISSNELRTFSVTSRRTLATESSCIMALNAGTSLSVKPVSRFAASSSSLQFGRGHALGRRPSAIRYKPFCFLGFTSLQSAVQNFPDAPHPGALTIHVGKPLYGRRFRHFCLSQRSRCSASQTVGVGTVQRVRLPLPGGSTIFNLGAFCPGRRRRRRRKKEKKILPEGVYT